MKFASVVFLLSPLVFGNTALACDLCAIYSANSARGESEAGVVLSLSELFTRFGTVQIKGERLPQSILDEAFLDSSITHIVPSYNFSPRLGVTLNVPIIHREFKRFELRPTGVFSEEGLVSGLGDVALVGRWAVLHRVSMKRAFAINVLGGIKFPTGDADHIRDEVTKAEAFRAIAGSDRTERASVHTAIAGGSGHQHEFGGVHEHDLALGSGSFDPVAGLTLNARSGRWFFSSLAQYYWRTEGESSFKFGNEVMISGGPGGFVMLNERYTLSLQANAGYESIARDDFLGSKSNNTGMTAWYLGPQLIFGWRSHFSANAGVDVPLRVANNGLLNVPDYRIHAGLTWSF